MIVLDGSMGFYYPPQWLLLLFIEFATVIVECLIIAQTRGWWSTDKTEVNYSRLVFIIALANVATAGIGIGFYLYLSL